MSKPQKERFVDWGERGPSGQSIRFEHIGHFDARGKRRVYGRCDQFGHRGLALNMDIWRANDGRLFARFWSRNTEVDECSYEIVGLSDPKLPDDAVAADFGEQWVPECLRQEYDNWVLSELAFVH